MEKKIDFIDRKGVSRQLVITGEEKPSGYKSISKRGPALRVPLLKLWLDGHLGVRHCCVTSGYSAGVLKGASSRVYQGAGVGARVTYKVAEPLPEEIVACVHVATGEVDQAAEIIAAFRPE